MSCKKFISLACFFLASCGGGGGDNGSSSRSTSADVMPAWVSSAAVVSDQSSSDLFGVYYENALFAEVLLREYSIFDTLNFYNVWRRDTGSQRQPCDRSGSLFLTIENNGRDTFVDFDNCVDADGNTTNGKIEVRFVESGVGSIDLKMTYDFIDVNISYSQGTSNIDITYVFDVDFDTESIVTTINGRGLDSREDDFDIQGLTFTSPISHSEYVFESEGVSGRIARENIGYVNLTTTSNPHKFIFSDDTNTFEGGYDINESEDRFPVMRFIDGQSPSENKVTTLPTGTSSPQSVDVDFFTTENIAPTELAQWRAAKHDFSDYGDIYKTENIPYHFHLNGIFYDPNGDFLEFEVTVVDYIVHERKEYPIPSTTDLTKMAISIERRPNSEFTATFPQPGQYRLALRAIDPDGRSSDYRYQWIVVEDDTDGDGIPSPNGPDDDNDGVDDHFDDFAYDDSETIDTDGDGIGNNADGDDDGDGVDDADDHFPLERFCSDELEGNEDGCYLTLFFEEGRQEWQHVFEPTHGYLYFSSPNYKEVAIFNVGEDKFLPAINLSHIPGSLTTMTYYERQNRLYIGFDNGDIYYLLPGETELHFFVNTSRLILSLVEVGDYLMVVTKQLGSTSTITNDLFSFDDDANEIDRVIGVLRVFGPFKWDKAFSQLYLRLSRKTIDVDTGLFIDYVTPEYEWPLGLSPDGTSSIRDRDEGDYPVLDTASGAQVGEIEDSEGIKPYFWFASGPVGFNVLGNQVSVVYWNNDFTFNRREEFDNPFWSVRWGYQWEGKLVLVGTDREDISHGSPKFLRVDVINVD